MYCTGGIRCERASALLREKGFENPIFQLQGGIHNYLEEFKVDGGHWIGKNYTFDKRFMHGADNAAILSKCSGCEKPWDKYSGKERCPGCRVPHLICPDCVRSGVDCVCALCKKQGRDARDQHLINKPKRAKEVSCGMCCEEFKSRNGLFRHFEQWPECRGGGWGKRW